MSSPQQILERWTARLLADPTLAASLGGNFLFEVTGADGGTWLIRTRKPIGLEEGPSGGDVTVTVASEELQRIASGEKNLQVSYNEHKIRFRGRRALGLRLHQLIAQ